MKLTPESLQQIISRVSMQKASSNFNSFICELQGVCGWFNENIFSDLQIYLSDEYGITNESQLRLASIDIENDILDFLNSKAA